jgi:hypothetical protein
MEVAAEEKLKELQEWQKQNGVNVDRVFFTADGELQYFPFCADFGNVSFCSTGWGGGLDRARGGRSRPGC